MRILGWTQEDINGLRQRYTMLSFERIVSSTNEYGRVGYIAVWDAQTILQLPEKDVQESLYFCAPIHETVVRCIAWHGYKDPVHFVSCGNDSHIKLTDYRDPWASIPLQRSRSIHTC